MPDAPALTLLTSHDCHLCEHSKAVLTELQAEGLLAWCETADETPEGQALAAVAPPIRPVLFYEGRVLAYGRLSDRRLRKQLRKLAKAA